MTPIVPDEVASTRPWGPSLAMAGAMAAGLAAGRSSTLVLAAGITAAVGLKILRRDVAERSCPVASPPGGLKDRAPDKFPKAETGGCCSGEEKSPEPDACEPIRAAADTRLAGPAQQAEFLNPDEGIPLVWEQGQDETVSRGAVGTQTVWFGMQEPTEATSADLSQDQFSPEAVPAIPAPEIMAELRGPDSCDAPDGDLVALPAVPVIAERPEAGTATSSPVLPPSRAPGGLPRFVAQEASGGSAAIPGIGVWKPMENKTNPDELHRGWHRSVVPQAPVAEQRRGRWMMVVSTLVLVIVALAVARGVLLRDGWTKGLTLPWQVARGGVQEQQLKEAGVWSAPLPQEK